MKHNDVHLMYRTIQNAFFLGTESANLVYLVCKVPLNITINLQLASKLLALSETSNYFDMILYENK